LEKAPDAFRTISEVADEIDVPQHVLRFWESRFPQIRPMKRGGGRRYYRPDDVDLLRGVRHLLYGAGYTIRGVQRILREQGAAFVQNSWRAGDEPSPPELDRERAGEALGEHAGAVRSEPNLFAVAPSRDQERGAATSDVRPLPEMLPPPSIDIAVAVTPTRQFLDTENRRKLQSALDELLACRRLLETAARRD
jgi:DNA-binding transcriptional MerR regulator